MSKWQFCSVTASSTSALCWNGSKARQRRGTLWRQQLSTLWASRLGPWEERQEKTRKIRGKKIKMHLLFLILFFKLPSRVATQEKPKNCQQQTRKFPKRGDNNWLPLFGTWWHVFCSLFSSDFYFTHSGCFVDHERGLTCPPPGGRSQPAALCRCSIPTWR